MKNVTWILLSAAGLVAFSVGQGACGSSNGSNTGGTGGMTTTTTTTTTTTKTNVTTGTGGSGGSGDCTGVLGGDCGTCLEGGCCADLAACNNDANCIDCVTGNATDTSVCSMEPTQTLLNTLLTCAHASCDMECFPPATPAPDPACDAPKTAPSNGSCITINAANGIECNPVTNEGCTKPGAGCDFSMTGFTCYDPPNDAMLCGACSNSAAPFCAGTTHCLEDSQGMNGKCGRFCCNDGDCGTGTCDTSITGVPGLGICVVAQTDGGSGTGGASMGTGGAGTGGAAMGTGGAGTGGAAMGTGGAAMGTGGADAGP